MLALTLLLILSLVCGSVAAVFFHFSRGGLLAATALGFIGGRMGVALAEWVGAPPILALHLGGAVFPLFWALAGIVLAIGVIAYVASRTRNSPERRPSRSRKDSETCVPPTREPSR